MAVSMLSVNTAEGFPDIAALSPTSIQRSPVKLLNTRLTGATSPSRQRPRDMGIVDKSESEFTNGYHHSDMMKDSPLGTPEQTMDKENFNINGVEAAIKADAMSEKHSYDLSDRNSYDLPEKNSYDTPEKQIYVINQKHGYDIPEKHSYDIPEKRSYDIPEKRSYDIPEKHSYDTPEKRSYDSPEKHSFDSPKKHKYDTPEKHSYDSPEKHSYDTPEKHSYDTPEKHSYELPPKATYELPAMNGHRNFPCIWLDGVGPTRTPEGADTSPRPPSQQPSPRDLAEVPPVAVTPPMPPAVSTPTSLHDSPLRHPLGLEGPPMGRHVDPFQALPGGLPQHKPTLGDTSAVMSSADGESMAVEVCPECHKVFKRKVYLQRHMEREHWSTAKVFKCEDCSYETKHQSNLSVHRRTHTGERPYHCGACGQRYTQGHLLKSHIRSRHAGNMELYNLEKKSESTRGRKSLDMKHDVGGTCKMDKISSLLQAAAANHQARPPQPPKYGGLLAPQMNPLPSFFNPLRPLMSSPLGIHPSMLSNNSRHFGPLLNGLGLAGMLPSMQQNLALMANQNGLNGKLALTVDMLSGAAGMKLPLHTPDLMGDLPTHMLDTKPKLVSLPTPPLSTPAEETGSAPQDLTTRRNPPPLEKVDLPPPPPLINGAGHELSTGTDSEPTLSPQQPHDMTPSPQTDQDDAMDLQTSDQNLDDCQPANCLYAQQLRQLRKNVLRMLSVFTPDLSVDNGIDYETDQVDRLLHEVIYSNMEDSD